MELLRPCALIRKAEVDLALAAEPRAGKHALEPLKSRALAERLPLNILEDCQVPESEAEVHRHEGDLWHCLEGGVTFVYGGRLIRPEVVRRPDGSLDDHNLKAVGIAGGTEIVLYPGDWLWIPAGQPHLHKTAGRGRLIIIKVPAVKEVPLEAVPGWDSPAAA